MPSKYTRITYVQYTYDTRRIYVLLCFRYTNKTTVSATLGGSQTPQSIWLKLSHPFAFDNFSGKLGRKDRIILRTRYGKTHAYTIENPYTGPATEAQNTMRSTFGMAVKQASAILKDPEQKSLIGSAVTHPTASTSAPLHPLVTTPPSVASSSPPSMPN